MADTTIARHAGAAPAVRLGRKSDYEHTVWPYVLALPFMATLAAYAHGKKTLAHTLGVTIRHNCFLGDGISVNGARVRDGAARWPALHAIYNFTSAEGPTVVHRIADSWWMNIRNAQAVRNRLKIARRELGDSIRTLAKRHGSVSILSLAAGTAQAVIEAVAECVKQGIDVRVQLMDQDETALGYARALARDSGVGERVETLKCNVFHFDTHLAGRKPDIIEMMGLIDYFSDLMVNKLFRKIRRCLRTGGHFFTCHIHPNGERYFMRHVINWAEKMRYRTREELHDLLVAGDFLSPRLITEPHGIHTVAVCEKIG